MMLITSKMKLCVLELIFQNFIFCQGMQSGSTENTFLFDQVLRLRWQAQKYIEDLRQLHYRIQLAKRQLQEFRNKAIPVGFVYIQYDGQVAPYNLWPRSNWKEVTSYHSGNFFREEGGKASAFGSTQSQALVPILIEYSCDGDHNPEADLIHNLVTRVRVSTCGYRGGWCSVRFAYEENHVAPTNRAIRMYIKTG